LAAAAFAPKRAGAGAAAGVSAGLFGGVVVNFFSQIVLISCTILPLIINFHRTNYSYVNSRRGARLVSTTNLDFE